MAIARTTLVLAGLVVALTVVCVALVVALDSYRGDYLAGVAREEEANAEVEPGGDGMEKSDPALLEHPWEKNPRLSREVLPLHYDLYLHPDLESGTFMGKPPRKLANSSFFSTGKRATTLLSSLFAVPSFRAHICIHYISTIFVVFRKEDL